MTENKRMKILFMGTPEISATCLCALIDGGCDIAAVVTREDKPRGRGNVLTPTPVKTLAISHGIPVYTPKTLRDEAFSSLLSEVNPDLILVVAFGKILPKNVIDYPKYGCINLHVSLLPKYRGAAPMQRAIMEGETETGVTLMYMDEGLDTGDIIEKTAFPISATDNFETIHDRSAAIGAERLLAAVRTLSEGKPLPREKQDDTLATYAPKVEKSDCHLDFSKSAARLDCEIRGVTPIPGAFALLGGKTLKILRATPKSGSGTPGKVLSLSEEGDGEILVACGEGALSLTEVLPEGKGRMSAAAFIRGRKIAPGDLLS